MPVSEVVTTEYLQRFVGGTVHIENNLEDYGFTGTIASLAIVGSDLSLQFSEVRRTRGEPTDDDNRLTYEAPFGMATRIEPERTKLVVDLTPVVWEVLTFECSADAAATAAPLPQPAALSTEYLTQFVGGDLEFHQGKGPMGDTWRGPIASVESADGNVIIKLRWCGFMANGAMQFKKDEKVEFVFGMSDYTVQETGGPKGRSVFVHREGMPRGLLVVFPAPHNLDPEKVEGLTI